MSYFDDKSLEEIYELIKDYKVIPTGRGKWAGLVPRLKVLLPFIHDIYGDVPKAVYTHCLKNKMWTQDSLPRCQRNGCENVCKVRSGNHVFSKTCSSECMPYARAQEYEKNQLLQFGVKNASQREDVKQTKLSSTRGKYGVDNVMQVKEIKEKHSQTLFERTGYYETFSNPETQKKAQEAFDRDWNGNPMFDPILRKQARDSREEDQSYRVKISKTKKKIKLLKTPMYSVLDSRDELKDMYMRIGAYELSSLLDCSVATIYKSLNEHNIPLSNDNRVSAPEKLITSLIEECGYTVENNVRILDDKEVDVYVPDLNLAIEYNGLRWHSTMFNRDKNYHKNKTDAAMSDGIRLIHIFEDEWLERRDVIESKIRRMCGVSQGKVYARTTKFEEVSNSDLRTLYNQHHIQGFVGASKAFALKDKNGDTVAGMSFNIKDGGIWDLNRFVTSCDVVGGFSKLLKNVIKQYGEFIDEIVSFADLRWSYGDVYEKNGFSYEYTTSQNYYYVVGKERIRKEHFRHSRMRDIDGFDYDPNETELQNTERNGIYRIYDCGLLKYSMKLI